MADQLGGSGEKDWKIRGGHRLWTAPEADHSYEPDNGPVSYTKLGDAAVEVAQPAGAFGFQKTLRVELLAGEIVRVTHLLKNVTNKALDVSPWVLSVMAPGGVALIPQPALDLHPSEFPEGRGVKPEEFLPNRELVLWALYRPDRRPLRLQRAFPARHLPAGAPRDQAGHEAAPPAGSPTRTARPSSPSISPTIPRSRTRTAA
ncbi:MAG: hypothetical protein WDO13_19405 [Verrucomicrobiota bacterium]